MKIGQENSLNTWKYHWYQDFLSFMESIMTPQKVNKVTV